jgi:hypothetical protein
MSDTKLICTNDLKNVLNVFSLRPDPTLCTAAYTLIDTATNQVITNL